MSTAVPGLDPGIDPAILPRAKKMNRQVKPAGDRWKSVIETRSKDDFTEIYTV